MGNNEIWMPVRGYEGLYEVSNEGSVRSLNYLGTGKTKELRAAKLKNGYLQVRLCKDGEKKFHYVHRLVWEAFRGKIPEGYEINHLDEVKTNNWLDNLEVCTCKENSNYGTRNERATKANINHPLKSKPVNQIDKVTGEVLNIFPSCMEAQRQTGIHHQGIVQCCLGKPRYKSAGGFIWQYAEK